MTTAFKLMAMIPNLHTCYYDTCILVNILVAMTPAILHEFRLIAMNPAFIHNVGKQHASLAK